MLWYNFEEMEIKVLQKPMEYNGCPIVIRLIGNQFEYITAINNEIYAYSVVVRKGFKQRLLLQPYTVEQLQKITNYMVAMAQTTIDTVLGGKAKPETVKSEAGGIPTPAGLLV